MLLGNQGTGKSSVDETIPRREEQPKKCFLFERMVCRRNIIMADINTDIDQRWKCVIMDTELIPFTFTKFWQGKNKTETEEEVVAENSINKIERGSIGICDKFQERGGGGRINFIQGLLGDLQPETISTSIRKSETLKFRPTLGE